MHGLSTNLSGSKGYDIIHESKAGDFVESMLACYDSYADTVPAPIMTPFYNTEVSHFADYFVDALIMGRDSWGFEKFGFHETSDHEWEIIDEDISDDMERFEARVFSDVLEVLDAHKLFYIVCWEDWSGRMTYPKLIVQRTGNSPLQEVW